MPTILSEDNIGSMSNEELLFMALKEYANPSNWEEYEKDYGAGRLIMRTAWAVRDKGDHARQALQIVAGRNDIFTELLEHIKAQHNAIDILMAMLIEETHKDGAKPFYPTQSPIWPTVEKTMPLIARAKNRAGA